MNSDFFKYLNQLELLAFFSAYPLLYAIVSAFFGKGKLKIVPLLPYAYALTGTLYLGLQLKNLYPDYSIDNIRLVIQPLVLKLLGLFSIFFWLPLLSRKPVISLLHSLIFFFLLTKDLFLHAFTNRIDKGVIGNNMKVFTDSFLLNAASLIIIFTLYYFLIFRKRNLKMHL